jgi:hypothetical protein
VRTPVEKRVNARQAVRLRDVTRWSFTFVVTFALRHRHRHYVRLSRPTADRRSVCGREGSSGRKPSRRVEVARARGRDA